MDLRDTLISPRLAAPRAELHDAPRLSPTPGRPVVLSPSWSMGADADAAPAQSLTDQLWGYWNQTTTGLHRLIWGTGAGVVTGLTIPREAQDPTAARQYLADLLEDLGELNAWPPEETARRVLAVRNVGNAATVVATVERCKAVGPPQTWPQALGWYAIADELQRAAALVSAGEAGAVFRSAAGDALEVAQAGMRNVSDKVDRGLDVAHKGAGAFGTGASVVLIGGGAAALAWFFAPELKMARGAKNRATGAR
jgi:hypothetical protein